MIDKRVGGASNVTAMVEMNNVQRGPVVEIRGKFTGNTSRRICAVRVFGVSRAYTVDVRSQTLENDTSLEMKTYSGRELRVFDVSLSTKHRLGFSGRE